MRVNAVIVAAGEGRRMRGGTAKAFLHLSGRPIILHTLERFAASQKVRKVILVAAEQSITKCRDLVGEERRIKHLECVLQSGGVSRQESVSRGLACLDDDCEIVVIHDGARPFVSPGLIDRCVEVAFRDGAVVVGVPARDTIKVISPDRRVQATPARGSLWHVQTPQAFQAELIRRAYREAERERIEATDDAMLVERLGESVTLLEGESTNIKITVPEDLLFAEALLREGKVP